MERNWQKRIGEGMRKVGKGKQGERDGKRD